MNRGRPPLWNVFADLAPGAWTEIVSLTSKERVSLPAPIRARLRWLSTAADGGLLAALDPGRSAELILWRGQGEGLIAGYREQLTHLPDTARDQAALALMDRFMKLSFEEPGRIGVPANLTSFLHAGESQQIRIVTADNRLWLWSEQAWQLQRAARLQSLSS